MPPCVYQGCTMVGMCLPVCMRGTMVGICLPVCMREVYLPGKEERVFNTVIPSSRGVKRVFNTVIPSPWVRGECASLLLPPSMGVRRMFNTVIPSSRGCGGRTVQHCYSLLPWVERDVHNVDNPPSYYWKNWAGKTREPATESTCAQGT